MNAPLVLAGAMWTMLGASLALPTGAGADQPITALAPVEVFAHGFQDLRGIVVDPDGTVFVADREAGTVTRIAPDRSRRRIASGLQRPIGLAFDSTGHLLIAEEQAGRVVRVEMNGSRTPIVSSVKQLRWLAVREDGTLFISARRLTRDADPEPDDESAEPEMILSLTPGGQLHVFADGFRDLQGLALNHTTLFAATRGRRGTREAEGVVYQMPILADASAGPPSTRWPADQVEKPVGVVCDRLGALYLTASALELHKTTSKRVIVKLHPTGLVTLFAANLENPQGLAFDASGNLYVADGTAGRVLRFLAPAAPTLTPPPFTNQSPLTGTGTGEPNARVDLFLNEAATPVTVTADRTGAFSAQLMLTPNHTNTLETVATAHGGDGLTSPPADVTIVHDSIPPTLTFQAPPAGSYVRLSVSVQAQASDSGSGVATLALTVDGLPLSTTVAPSLPASSATATASWLTTTAPDGSHTLGATATDRAGNTTAPPTTRVVLVDNTPPDTVIVGGPSGEISVGTATFSFTGTDNLTAVGNLQFAWRLDGGAFTPFGLAATAVLSGLSDGTHIFEVKALDVAGNEDPTPAVRTFTVRFGPAITTVDPARGPIGAFVTITGMDFEPGTTQVSFNGLAPVVRTVTLTTITTTVPIGATTGSLTVTTSRGSTSRTFTVTTTGDFALTAAPVTARVIAGDQTSVNIAAGGSGSFTSLVSLSVAALPSGISAGFSESAFVAPGSSAFVTLALATTVAPGSYGFTVTGQAQVDGRTVTRTAAFSLEVLAPATPAVTGRVLTAEAVPQPIPGVTITLGAAFTLTDAGGNFVLLAPPAGQNMLLVDGRTASTPTAQYPPVEVNLAVNAAGTTRVPFIVYLPQLDTANPVSLPLDSAGFTMHEVKATTPTIPGVTVTIPAGTRIIGPDGNAVSQLTITPLPIDRSPMPYPPGITAPMLFSLQPGGAVPSQPLPITFPNVQDAPPGSEADLYFFDIVAGAWATWGTGTVSADGTQIVSDPGFGLPRFAWHFPFSRASLSDQVRTREAGRAQGGEPVDLPTGRFVVQKTDLVLPGRIPVTIQRTYRSENPLAGLLGLGWTLDPYDTVLTTAGTSLSLILPDQSTSLFAPSGSGQWTNTAQTFLRGAVLTQLPGDFRFQLRYKDGTVHVFGRIPGFANLAGLAAITDRNGNTVTLTRGTGLFDRRILQITEPAGRTLTLGYDTQGRITSVTDPIGRVVQYSYDALGRLITVTDPAGGITRYTYDAQHRILTITDPRNITFLTNEYDANGRVARQTQADGGIWGFAYELTGTLVTGTSITDPRGNPTRYRFNSLGFTLSTTDALGQTTSFEYANDSNLLLATTDPLGRTTRFAYDAQGNVTSLTNAAGNTYSFTYETTFNRVTDITDPLGQTRRFEYDAAGNLTATLDRLNQRTTIVSDGLGQPTSLTDPLGQTRQFTYDAAGNALVIVDPLGNPTTDAYDTASRLVSRKDERGRTTRFVYDALDRVTQVIDPLNGFTGFSYDGNGNLVTVTDARGSTIAHTYDSTDRLVARTDPAGAVERFEYDLRGNPVRKTDRKGQVSTFAYDALNRRVAAAYADGMATAVRYDAAGRPVELTDSAGSPVLNAYDSLDRLLVQASAAGTVTYQYDALGRRTGLTVPGQPPIGYAYDAASHVTQIVQGGRAVELAYDAAGRRTRVTLPNQVSTDYQHDAASRLLALTYRNASGPLGELTYQYDVAGNRLRQGGTFSQTALPGAWTASAPDAANRMASAGDVSLTYDANGSVTSLSDAAGVTTFTWDARNRLVAVSGAAGAATFGYDALGRRAAKTVNGALTQYLYDALGIVQELGEGAPTQYLRGPGPDEPLVRDDREFYLAGDLGSIVALTDADGAVTTRYTYDPYGATTASGAGSANPFQYTGRENDGVAGLYWYRSRPYAPRLHRFLSEDVIGLLGGLNLYRYAANNPLAFFDPLGLKVTLYYLPGHVQNGSKSYPHAAMLVNGNAYSFYPQSEYRDLRAVIGTVPGDIRLNYDNRQLHRDGVESEELDTSDSEDDLIEGILHGLLQAQARGERVSYNVFGNGALNCVTFLLHVLRTAGVQVPSAGFQPAWLLPRVRGQQYPGANQTGPIQGP